MIPTLTSLSGSGDGVDGKVFSAVPGSPAVIVQATPVQSMCSPANIVSQASHVHAASTIQHGLATMLVNFTASCDLNFKQHAEESIEQRQMLEQLRLCIDSHHVRLRTVQEDHLQWRRTHEEQTAAMRNALFETLGLIRKDL